MSGGYLGFSDKRQVGDFVWRLFQFFMLMLILFSLTGCATFSAPFVPEFDRGTDTPKKYVYVDHRWEMDVLCRQKEAGILGCATIPSSANGICVIVLYRNGPAETKEHEGKHCQFGRYHP